MGILDKFRFNNIYEKRIRSFGIHPSVLPPDLHAKLCTSAHREAQYYKDNKDAYGSDSKSLAEQSFLDLADTVVLCLIGPKEFDRLSGYSHLNIIEYLVDFWVNSGPESESGLLAVHGVNRLGKLNSDFASIFIDARMAEEARKRKRTK